MWYSAFCRDGFFKGFFLLKLNRVHGMANFGAVVNSIISGVFAASAGVAGKLAFDEALITNSCLQVQSIYNSSEVLLGWIESIQFLPQFFHHTDVCSTQVGSCYLMSFCRNSETVIQF